MFKLESYITPIIMNQVAKYVKNIRPQDAQVSLWEGEVAFQNVDLRLDVLEEELNLPFEFLSGHIHELVINVPWLKIAVEPIVIDINTIEFVLKLKDPNETGSAAQRLKKIEPKKENDDLINPGVLYNLINNIVINCHNIILKYVEDDIVVSMNIQHLSINSANSKWIPAFIDIGSSELLKRKLIKISDLTICLDKRNSEGLIEVCQEPILYRCSLEIRIINTYKIASKSESSKTRIGIFSKLIEINTSSLQFPMVMRLVNLITALKGGNLKPTVQTETDEDQYQDNHDVSDNSKSFFSSLWDYMPTITIYFDDETDKDTEQKGHILDFGIYIEKLNFTLKFSEFISDTIVGTTKKLRYSPILKIGLNGIYAESVIINDINWGSTKGGVSGIYIEPLGIYAETVNDSNYLLHSNLVATTTYLENSIFDENTNNGYAPTKYITDLKSYESFVTNTYLKYRSPTAAFDMVHKGDTDNDNIDDIVNVQSQLRVMMASITIRYNHNVWLGVINDFKELIETYDYPPYYDKQNENDKHKLHPPSLDDYDSLMADIPLKKIQFHLESITAEIYTKIPNRKQLIKGEDIQLPFFRFYVGNVNGQLTTPLDPIKLVHTTCQLPEKPVNLLQACYHIYTFSIANIEGGISTQNCENPNKLINIPKMSGDFESLILPNLWKDKTIPHIKFQIVLDHFIFSITKPQCLIGMQLWQNVMEHNEQNLIEMLRSSALSDLDDTANPSLENRITNIQFDIQKCHTKFETKGQISTIESYFQRYDSTSNSYISLNTPFFHTSSKTFPITPWFQWHVGIFDITTPMFSVIAIWMTSFTWVIDSNVADFLKYKDNILSKYENLDDGESERGYKEMAKPMLRKTSKLSLNSERAQKKFTREETIHLSSEKDDIKEILEEHVITNTKPDNQDFYAKLLNIAKTLLIYIEISHGFIYLCSDEVTILPPPLGTLIILPNIVCKSALTDGISRSVDFVMPSFTKINKSTLPWTCHIKDFSIKCFKSVGTKVIVEDAHTTITMALVYKTTTSSEKSHEELQRKTSVSKKKRNLISMTLHIDTSPFCIEMSSDIVTIVGANMQTMFDLTKLIKGSKIEIEKESELKMVNELQEAENLNDFLENDYHSDSGVIRSNDQKLLASFLIQWTITKVYIGLESSSTTKTKLSFEIEDLITTIDNQKDFIKFTFKIGSLNTNYYELNAKNDWIINNSLKIKMAADTVQSLLNVIITTVSLREFYQKIGVKKTVNLNRSITEIVINLRALDIIFDLSKLIEFMPYICALPSCEKTEEEVVSEENKSEIIDSVGNLPMIHFDCKGLTVYMPIQAEFYFCSVLIFKIEEIKVSPNLENPLQRTPVRKDIFNKAAELGILNMQGSAVEDRQYEIILKSMSAATGNWQTILSQINENSNSTYNFLSTNPAFEWNNKVKKPSMSLRKIFDNFTFIITIAPCIIYNNILICGRSIEFNCSTDFICDMTTDQINLLNCIGLRLQDIQKSMCRIPKKTYRRDHFDYNELTIRGQTLDRNDYKKNVYSHPTPSGTDSGFESMNKSCVPKPIELPEKHLPYTISFVSGIFLIKFFKYIRKETVNEDEETIIEETMTPLIALTINQPTFIISQTMFDQSIRFSLFDLKIHLGKTKIPDDEKSIAQFPTAIAYTQRGKPCNSGFSPSLINIRLNLTKLKKCEIDIEISKPTIINVSEHIIEHLTNIVIILYEAILTNPCYVPALKPVHHGSKVHIIRRMFFNADHFNIKTDSVIVKLFKKKTYFVKFAFMDIMALLSFTQRPEKFNLKGSINGLYIQTETKIFLHPVGIRVNVDLTEQIYSSVPTTNANVRFNVFQLDIGVRNVQQLNYCYNGLMKSLGMAEIQWSTFVESISSHAKDQSVVNSAEPFDLPPLEKKFRIHKDELYQDDLRAGAFQFIEMTTDNILPLPYQIQIIKKNYGIICWRYPQPRKIRNVQVYPVPMASSNPINIKCSMEYYSEVNELFLHYTDFWLSETESKSIELPNRVITASIWRVVIMQSLVTINGEFFDTSEEDEDISSMNNMKIEDLLLDGKNDEKDFVLHPKVLVGCMRVDTLFNASLVPKGQILIAADLIHINIQNQQTENTELPALLKKYKPTSSVYADQTFLSLVSSNSKIYGSFLNFSSYTIETNLTFSIECLDYGYSNMLPLCEESNINAFICCDENMDINVVIDKIKINFCLSILHSLLVSKNNWHEHLDTTSLSKKTLITRFVIVNRSNLTLYFGQSDTEERLQLKPKECSMYSFQSDYFDQKLNFYIVDENMEIIATSSGVFISTNFKLYGEKDYYLRNVLFNDKQLIVVKVKKLSTTQIAIFIKGQFELISMVSDVFRLQFRNEVNEANKQSEILSDHIIESNDRLSIVQSIRMNDNIIMRLRLIKPLGKGWTGDIPLKPNKNLPWLVKVPISGNDGFISYWVRIIREDIDQLATENSENILQKVLITIWPIFEIRSMLTCNLNITESVTKVTLDLEPAGKTVALQVPATHQTNHQILINNICSSKFPGKDRFNLTLKSVDWNKFFWYNNENWDVESTLVSFAKSEMTKWPTSNEEELRLTRQAQFKMPTSVSYKCNKCRQLGCTLSLEICPWALIINSIGEKVGIKYPDDERLEIESNQIEMMLEVTSYFIIQISNGPGWVASLPIFLKADLCKHLKETERYLLNENDSITIVINDQNFVSNISLHCTSENNLLVFFIKPIFVVTNFSHMNLFVTPFCLAEKETTYRSDIASLTINQILLPIIKSTENSKGIPLDYFCDLYSKTYPRHMHTSFVYFVCFRVDASCEISVPIPLSKTFTRRCFSLQRKEKSFPFSVNLLEKNGVYYLNVFDDHHSLVYINNQTKVPLLIAETEANENAEVASVIPEYENVHFEWFQIIRPLSELFYTPPTVYNKFPEIQPVLPNLTISILNEESKDIVIKWSKVISIDKSYEKFLHIANHGDVKIIVCDKHKIVRISISYIAQQLEFSVKDLRSRILVSESSDQLKTNWDNEDQSSAIEEKLMKENVQLVKSTESFKCAHQVADNNKISIKIRVFVKELSANFSMNSTEKQYLKSEIIASYLDDFIFNFDINDRKMNISIANLQIDNQLYNTGNFDFPVMLCSRELYKRTKNLPSVFELGKDVESFQVNPMIDFAFRFYIDDWELRDIYCNFQPIRAYIEDSYVNDILDILTEIIPSNAIYMGKRDPPAQDIEIGAILIPKDIVKQALYLSEPIKLRSIHIQPMDLLLSVHTSIRLYIALDHSPLEFSTFRRHNVLSLPFGLGHSVGMHYLSGALFGAGWVVGSLEMLGSPSGLARSFSIGLRDFVSMPVQGLLRGPWGFLVGITQGSASLIRNITAGTVNSVSKLAGSVSRNLDRLTLDKEHIERTDALRRSRPQGFTEGFSQGLTGLGINILGAVGGIARHTLEAKSPGQVVTGVGKGIFGALAKPISGAAELVSLTGQGMLYSVGFNAMPQQRSPSTSKNIAICPSDSKIWKLLPNVLITDQILFKHDVTLIRPEGLKMSAIYLTSTVLACMDMNKNRLEYVLQIDHVNAYFDQNDRTIIHIKYREPPENESEEEVNYTSQRIMNFLRASHSNSEIPDICFESLDDILKRETIGSCKKIDWSFYISEHMGRHLLQYLKVINCKID